jgi:hypothetical protein
MKASSNYRATNRYVKPSNSVRPGVVADHERRIVRLELHSEADSVKFLIEMTPGEARNLARSLELAYMDLPLA